MIRRPPRSTLSSSSAASDVYKRQVSTQSTGGTPECDMEDDGFVLVRPRKGKRHRGPSGAKVEAARAAQATVEAAVHDEVRAHADQVAVVVSKCKEIVSESRFKHRAIDMIRTWLGTTTEDSNTGGKDQGVVDIVCLGLGRVGSSAVAQHQAGLLLAMASELPGVRSVAAFDPVLSREECQALRLLGVEVSEPSSYRVQRTTLFYMPHCEGELYNNVLWANRDHLERVGIVGNSLSAYRDSLEPLRYTEGMPACACAMAAMEELSIQNDYRPMEIFNNTALHTWPRAQEMLGSVAWPAAAVPLMSFQGLQQANSTDHDGLHQQVNLTAPGETES
eukprot:TRINITY_DN26540_c0_g1_i3.p1 TRINITY_DN26540_c0_g1~~TRINITY_DN26540_c0_g1_i3.p1  ORF type:complete len:334 (-),score=69.12 TRINITY_DN26540_c0_g1_i3:406-1407(-)